MKWFSSEKGYGFIRQMNGKEIFVHHTGIVAEGFRSLEPEDKVTFLIEPSKEDQSRVQAVDVRKVD